MDRKQQIRSWFLDQSLLMGYWGDGSNNDKRSYHHTAPVNSLYALHEALVLLRNETLETSWLRHNQNHEVLRDGLETLGLRYFVDPECRLPQLNSVYIPDGVDDVEVRAKLLTDYGLEIGGGLGALAGKIWRIGLMGAAANPSNVALCLKALADVLPTKH
jgi:alanine-glyoxylate transaminase/serine-glyoxylate transaminase/serine-pyruvate transaminase